MEIEISDERDIGIVCVDDLVDNEVLVVKEKPVMDAKPLSVQSWMGPPPTTSASVARHGNSRDLPTDPFRRSHDQAMSGLMPAGAVSSKGRSRGGNSGGGGGGDPTSCVMVGVPQLSHFIQCNSFGYYFLAEAENVRLMQSQAKTRRAHCIVKVPHAQGEVWSV